VAWASRGQRSHPAFLLSTQVRRATPYRDEPTTPETEFFSASSLRVRPSRTALFTPALTRAPSHRDCERLTARMDPRPEPRAAPRHDAPEPAAACGPGIYTTVNLHHCSPMSSEKCYPSGALNLQIASGPVAIHHNQLVPSALKRRFPSGAES